jgi:hypothetical protein
MRKFKIGQKVRIKSLEEIEKTLSPNPSHKDSLGMVGFLKFNRDMIRYCGEVVTVSRVASRT